MVFPYSLCIYTDTVKHTTTQTFLHSSYKKYTQYPLTHTLKQTQSFLQTYTLLEKPTNTLKKYTDRQTDTHTQSKTHKHTHSHTDTNKAQAFLHTIHLFHLSKHFLCLITILIEAFI
jgi:hypothetical protein